jgi:hypothetical protein
MVTNFIRALSGARYPVTPTDGRPIEKVQRTRWRRFPAGGGRRGPPRTAAASAPQRARPRDLQGRAARAGPPGRRDNCGARPAVAGAVRTRPPRSGIASTASAAGRLGSSRVCSRRSGSHKETRAAQTHVDTRPNPGCRPGPMRMLPPALFRSINQRHASNEFGGRPFTAPAVRPSMAASRLRSACRSRKAEGDLDRFSSLASQWVDPSDRLVRGSGRPSRDQLVRFRGGPCSDDLVDGLAEFCQVQGLGQVGAGAAGEQSADGAWGGVR